MKLLPINILIDSKLLTKLLHIMTPFSNNMTSPLECNNSCPMFYAVYILYVLPIMA